MTSYQYNGLGDRLTETVNGVTTTFTMDISTSLNAGLNTGLTQALSDGTNDYLYGAGRIAQIDTATLKTEYFLGDALGSVRQLTDSTGAVTLARTYDPYGKVNTTNGAGSSGYGFTGEYQSGDSVYLRSRFYTPSTGRFLTRDTWSGNANRPLSLNRWGYVEGNPVNLFDPTGMSPECDLIAGSRNGDYSKCEKIIRDLDPNNSMSLSQVYVYDLFRNSGKNGKNDEECLPNLFFALAIPFSGKDTDTSETYGFWFHFLLNNAPGGWNRGGRMSTSFLKVAALALDHEISEAPGLRGEIMGFATDAFVRKGWQDGFYRMIGSRQVVRSVVDKAIMFARKNGEELSWTRLYNRNRGNPGNPNQPEGDYSFGDALSVFAAEMNNFHLEGDLERMLYDKLSSASYHSDGGGNAPYEWGNPPVIGMPAGLRTALGVGHSVGIGENQVFYKTNSLKYDGSDSTTSISGVDYFSVFFVVTQNQATGPLCGGSCVVSP